MSSKEIVGLLTLRDKDGNVIHQGGNVSYRYQSRARTIFAWNTTQNPTRALIVQFPWKMAFLLSDDDINIGHDTFQRANGANYPDLPLGSNTLINSTQHNFFRDTGTVGTISSALIPRVFGSIGANSNLTGVAAGRFGFGDSVISQVDVPLDYTQIGVVYIHPAHQQANTVSTAVGLPYVTYTTGQFFDNNYIAPGCFGIIRIETGSDAGFYYVQNNDMTNNRLYLRNLDGTPFVGQAAASGLTVTAGPGRRAWFNETGIIPLSVGTVDSGGRYNPRNAALGGDPALRESFILRIALEKSGSTEAAVGTEQQGSYLISLRPFTHGDGALSASISDTRALDDYLIGAQGTDAIPAWISNFTGGCNAAALDWVNQRLWFGITNSSNQSSIFHWRYKTSESFREVASYLGTAGSASFLTPALVLGAGDVISDAQIGSTTGSSANWVYFTVYHASGGNAGVIVIKPDLTTLQYTTGTGVPSAVLSGSVIDRSRTRAIITADVSTNGANQVTSASGNFTASDIGRAIKLTGLGADSGTYLIATIVSGTQVTVTTLAGAGVTFTNQAGGLYEIGDRLYLFFNNGTTGAAKINYMESMAPGTFLTRAVTMTNGANINTRVTGGTGIVFGQRALCSIDRANGDVYWLSNDTQQQINKYAVATNTHSLIAINNATLLSPAGGVVIGGANPATNPATPTLFSAIHVNSKFDDIWVGSDQGFFKIVKSTFSASTVKRYFGADQGTYVSGVPTTTGTGNGTTGLSFANPNVTLNASGTPFTAAVVDKYIIITGATTAANNGAFRITAFNSSSQIVYTNASGATQANYAGTFYIVSAYALRGDGGLSADAGNSRYVRHLIEGVDGRMYSLNRNNATTQGQFTMFSQEADNWSWRAQVSDGNSNEVTSLHMDTWGRIFALNPSAASSSNRCRLIPTEIEYQWDNANTKWIPKEHVKTSMPNKSVSDTTSPNALGRPIHSTFQDVIMGAQVRFNRQGGATPPNNEFLGRGGQSRTTAADGSTTINTGTFGGSSFSAGDVGKILRLESGATLQASEYRCYKITGFTNSTTITIGNMDGSLFRASASSASQTYTVWDLGTPGANAGPENITMLLADGFSKDNTQDISGITYEMFGWKTRFSEYAESRKFVVENPLGLPGTTGTPVYYETYPRAAPQYNAGVSHHRALPSAEVTNGRQVVDWMTDKTLDGTGNRATLRSSPNNAGIWYGNAGTLGSVLTPTTGVLGATIMVDLGKDVEIGYVQIRVTTVAAQYSRLLDTANSYGLIANVYNAVDGTAPVVATEVRTNGTTNLNIAGATVQTATVASGDLLGAITTGPLSTGAITAGQNTFVAALATFVTSDYLKVLNITAGAGTDNGAYRIIAVSPDGSTVTVRALDQTATAWGSSASSLTFTVQDAVREEDQLAAIRLTDVGNGVNGLTFSAGTMTLIVASGGFSGSPDNGRMIRITGAANPANNGIFPILTVTNTTTITYTNPNGASQANYAGTINVIQHWLCVDRLLTSTSLQLRYGPDAPVTNLSWLAIKPTWTHVKRLSYSTEAVPPDVKNNLTWATNNGRGRYDHSDVLMYFDLTDLTVAQRTGRWWKWAGIPRTGGQASVNTEFYFSTVEFFSPSGTKLGTSRYSSTDQSQTNADFFFSYLSRVDFIQAASDAMSGVAGFNGNANLGGAGGDTITPTTGGNKFLGFQVRIPYTDGNTGSPNLLNSPTANWVSADVGRMVRMTSGTYSGNFYRIASRVSATQVTLTTPSGGAPALATDAGPMNFTVHEGISVNGTAPDKFTFRRLATAGDATTTVATNQVNSASGAFTLADIGKAIRIVGATNDNGTYVIKFVNSATQVEVVSGALANNSYVVPSFVGGTGGTLEVLSDMREYTIATINDALTSITITETLQPAQNGRAWEIRRPAYDSSSAVTDATKTARILRAGTSYPVQSGDMSQDRSGFYQFFAEDIGSGHQRNDGVIAGGNGVFTGTAFYPDIVGRLLYIDSGVNKGIYEISVYTSATSITVKNHYTGAAVSFTADAGPVTYRILGERRFILSKYCTGLRA